MKRSWRLRHGGEAARAAAAVLIATQCAGCPSKAITMIDNAASSPIEIAIAQGTNFGERRCYLPSRLEEIEGLGLHLDTIGQHTVSSIPFEADPEACRLTFTLDGRHSIRLSSLGACFLEGGHWSEVSDDVFTLTIKSSEFRQTWSGDSALRLFQWEDHEVCRFTFPDSIKRERQ